MNRIIRIVDIIEKYFPADSILNKIPNFKYKNYYVITDNIIGMISSKNDKNYKSDYSHIDEYTCEDILAMNIHKSLYDIHTEKDIAQYFYRLINELPLK